METINSRWSTYGDISTGRKTMTRGFSPRSFFAQRAKGDTLSAAMGADPADNAYFCIYVGAAQGAIDPFQVECMVQIDYLVMLSEPKNLGQS